MGGICFCLLPPFRKAVFVQRIVCHLRFKVVPLLGRPPAQREIRQGPVEAVIDCVRDPRWTTNTAQSDVDLLP